eukprot:113559_1
MQPLINTNQRGNGTFLTKYKSRKYWNGKSLCIISILLFIVIIAAISYFGSSSSTNNHLNNNNPARNFLEKPDNSIAYPSQIAWKEEKRRPPPKPGSKLAPGENTDDIIYGIPDKSTGFDSSWQAPPPGADGTTVNGVTYGGDDVTAISLPDDFEQITDGEVPFGYVPYVAYDDDDDDELQTDDNNNNDNNNDNNNGNNNNEQPSNDKIDENPNGIYP